MDLSKAPKPPKIPAWRNVIYAWGKLRQQEGPAYFFLLPLSIVCEVAAPLLAVGLPSVVVRMYQTGSPWQQRHIPDGPKGAGPADSPGATWWSSRKF